MFYAANNCRRKSLKKHTRKATFTRIIYQIRFWSGQGKTLSFYAVHSSFLDHTIQDSPSTQVCPRCIVVAKREMKIELRSQSKAKLVYQNDLATYIIDRKHAHLCVSSTLSYKIPRDNLIENKIRSIVGSRTRDRAKAEPGLVKKIADLTIFNQSKGKSGSYAHAARVGMQNHSKSKSLLHLTS
jgi:hypothetical protein